MHELTCSAHIQSENLLLHICNFNELIMKPMAIIQSIHDYLCAGGKASDIAILVRRWSQTLLFELCDSKSL